MENEEWGDEPVFLIRTGNSTARVVHGKRYIIQVDGRIIDENGNPMNPYRGNELSWKVAPKNDQHRNIYGGGQSEEEIPMETNKQKAEDNNVPNFEVKVFIGGKDAASMSDKELFRKIKAIEGRIKRWNEIVHKPIKLNDSIKELETDIEDIVEYIDRR